MNEIELHGLDGGNLLGYLAALGTLRALTLAEPGVEVRMSWTEKGWWTPVIHHPVVSGAESLLQTLEPRLCGERTINPGWQIGNDLNLKLADFRVQLVTHATVACPGQRETADFLTAFGSDAFGDGNKKAGMSDTEFRTMSGAGHQHFLAFMRELAAGTTIDHLQRALFSSWDYSDGRPSLRWDPADYRPHALRAEDPSGDPIKTMRGANRLAVEALPLFPTVPEFRQVRTVAFQDRDKATEISWPIWIEELLLTTVASLLSLKGVQQEVVQPEDRSALSRRGIVQVFRARRFTDGKYRNFSPARSLL